MATCFGYECILDMSYCDQNPISDMFKIENFIDHFVLETQINKLGKNHVEYRQ